MSDLPSQRRYAPWAPIGQPGESTPLVRQEFRVSSFLFDGTTRHFGQRSEFMRSPSPSSLETFWVQRPKPIKTHKPTRFDTESFISLNQGPGLFSVHGSKIEEGDNMYTVTRITFETAYDIAFPWSFWDWPEADAPRQALGDYYDSHELGSAEDDIPFLYRYESPYIMDTIYAAHEVFFKGTSAPQPAPVDFEQVDRLARSRIASKLAEGDVNISVFFAELPDGWRWLATMGTRLISAILSLMRGDVMGAISSLRIKESRRQRRLRTSGKLASWDDFILEYNYAFRPLMSDLYGFLEAYISGLQEEGNLIHVRTLVSDEGPIDDLISYGGYRGQRGWGRNNMRPASMDPDLPPSVAVSYVVTYRVTDTLQRSLQELGLINPLEVAWERIPFSFLIDWLVNFNSILSSATAEAGVEFVDGCKTTYAFSPLQFSQEDEALIESNAKAFLSSAGFGPEYDGILEYHSSPLGYWFEVNRYPLDDFKVNMDTTKLALTINPFKSDSRLLNFLALINKVIKS